MFNEAKKAYGICKQENYPDDQTKAICRVFNTETSRALYEKQVMEKEGITIVNFSETSDVEDYRSCGGLSSIEMDPCEALLIKEQIRIMMELIEDLPEKYRKFALVALETGNVGVFEDERSRKYGEVDAMASLMHLSKVSVRKYAKIIKEILRREGKKKI